MLGLMRSWLGERRLEDEVAEHFEDWRARWPGSGYRGSSSDEGSPDHLSPRVLCIRKWVRTCNL